MDRFKNNIENVIFSNKTQFIKNRRQGQGQGNKYDVSTKYNNRSGSDSGSGSFFGSIFGSDSSSGSSSQNILKNSLNSSSNNNISSNWIPNLSLLLWLLLLILIIIISYLTVMTAKYLSTDCQNKRSWFNYIFRFCYNDVCLTPKVPVAPIVNNIHFMKPGEVPPQIPYQPRPYNSNIDSKSDPLLNKHTSTIESKKSGVSIPLFGKREVFHIANQDYTYEQAKCKCESYNAKLATYDQLVDAYNDGAEWCTYGWSSGQKAYYPTQKCNWEKKGPEEKLKCGNPGLNGGFFADPSLKFGVNCYGKKPKGKVSKLKDPVCNKGSYCQLPQNFGASNRLETDEISAFNNDKWNN